MQENKDNAAHEVKQGGIGRINTASENQEQQQGQTETRDISEIDQQEGTMNHGTLGGNFDSTSSNTASEGNNNR